VGADKTIKFLIVDLFHVSKQTNNKQTNKEVLGLLCHGRQTNKQKKKFLVSFSMRNKAKQAKQSSWLSYFS